MAAHPEEVDRRFPRRFLLAAAGSTAVAGVAETVASPAAHASVVGTAWKLGGNGGVTSDGTNFIGTTTVAPLIFKTKASATDDVTEKLRIQAGGFVGIGMPNPVAKLDVWNPGSKPSIRGVNTDKGGTGIGVKGLSSAGIGVAGASQKHIGMTADGGYIGISADGDTYGGVFTTSDGTAVYASGPQYGSYSIGGTCGAYGSGSTYGLYGTGPTGVSGSGTATGIRGASTATSGEVYGVYGSTRSADGYGLYSNGNCHVNGTLSKAAGSFRIDHPLDPDNKWLSHSFVESPDMMNVYNGNATLDAAGCATVTLPDYFVPLNRDYRYQLTPIGASAPGLHIAAEVTESAFKIAGGPAGTKVSWQVTGIRRDSYANERRIFVETDKAKADRGARSFVPSRPSAGEMTSPMTPADVPPTLVPPRRG